MGKRKERRLAAINAAGRRVKLDLFAEPDGEVVREATKEEGSVDQVHHAGVPISPVTSDQKQANPLLLLGQYSDDELNDDATSEHESKDSDDLVAVSTKENDHVMETGVAESDFVNPTTVVGIKGSADESDGVIDTDGNDPAEHDNHVQDTAAHALSPRVSELQNSDNSIDVWKVLMDEQTGRYYYWNTQTGETSWDVPEGSHIPSTIDNSSGYIAEGDNVLDSCITHSLTQSVGHYSSSTVVPGVLYSDALTVPSIIPMSQTDSHPSINSQFLGSESEDKHLSAINYNYSDGGEADPDRLVKYGELLIERLKSAEQSSGSVELQNWRLKCISEIETRVFDCKTLSSFGSALLPFWWHCYTQLNQIEDALNQEVALKTESSEVNENITASSIKEDIPGAELPLPPEPPKDSTNSPEPDISVEEQVSKPTDNSSGTVEGAELEDHVEDVDMDVDMEVDEELDAEQAKVSLRAADEETVPPPPPDDWIPPPPPPEEEPPLPPPEACSSLSHPTQLSASYTAPAFEYYAGVPGAEYYSDPQPLAPAPHYDVALVQPVVYYDVPAAINRVSDALGFHLSKTDVLYPSSEPPSSSASISSDLIASRTAESTTTRKSLPVVDPSTSGVVQSSVSVPSSIAVQSKVSRVKKRSVAVAPSLRSNKKVSSLVDKWKAAKEELHGEDEDEPEDAVEVLERKRQKEIEQWKARQIASGEAQENANFVPLGVDWRERVKRRRSDISVKRQVATEDVTTSEGDKPDLASFSRGLPSGWEVYWDESSKSVYYANSKTSETRWTRPSS